MGGACVPPASGYSETESPLQRLNGLCLEVVAIQQSYHWTFRKPCPSTLSKEEGADLGSASCSQEESSVKQLGHKIIAKYTQQNTTF